MNHVRRGVAAGEFREGLDLDIVIDGLYGPIYYRLLVPYASLSNSYIDALAVNLLRGIAAPLPRQTSGLSDSGRPF
jgi:hypothetical protein